MLHCIHDFLIFIMMEPKFAKTKTLEYENKDLKLIIVCQYLSF